MQHFLHILLRRNQVLHTWKFTLWYSLSLHAGNRLIIKLGDKEVEFNPDFKFYITTKLSNPQYTPEISTKAAIVNFAVKEQGLEAQLLGIVVRKERPELEEQKDSLVVNIAQSKKKLVELEDEILRYWTTHFTFATGGLTSGIVRAGGCLVVIAQW